MAGYLQHRFSLVLAAVRLIVPLHVSALVVPPYTRRQGVFMQPQCTTHKLAQVNKTQAQWLEQVVPSCERPNYVCENAVSESANGATPLSRMQLNNEERLRGVSGDRGRQIT